MERNETRLVKVTDISVQGQLYGVSEHCVERYIERVKPAFTTKQAVEEIERLAEFMVFTTEQPKNALGEKAQGRRHVGFLVFGNNDVVFPAIEQGNGIRWVLTTLTAGLVPTSARPIRKRGKKKMNRTTSQGQGIRGKRPERRKRRDDFG